MLWSVFAISKTSLQLNICFLNPFQFFELFLGQILILRLIALTIDSILKQNFSFLSKISHASYKIFRFNSDKSFNHSFKESDSHWVRFGWEQARQTCQTLVGFNFLVYLSVR